MGCAELCSELFWGASADSLALVAAISPVVSETVLAQATRGDRILTEMKKAKLRLMFNAVRLKFGGSPLGTDATTVPADSASVSLGVQIHLRLKPRLKSSD